MRDIYLNKEENRGQKQRPLINLKIENHRNYISHLDSSFPKKKLTVSPWLLNTYV